MKENNAIKKIFNKLFNKKEKESFDRQIMHPAREWFIGLAVALILLIFGGVLNYRISVQFSNVSVDSNNGEDSDVVYKANLIDSALEDFNFRKKSYEALKEKLMKGNKAVVQVVDKTSTENDIQAADNTPEIVPQDEGLFLSE